MLRSLRQENIVNLKEAFRRKQKLVRPLPLPLPLPEGIAGGGRSPFTAGISMDQTQDGRETGCSQARGCLSVGGCISFHIIFSFPLQGQGEGGGHVSHA